MNKTLDEALVFARGLAAAEAARKSRVQRFVIPAFTACRQVKTVLAATSIKVGAQNMHWANAGAWTGEVSPLMLKDCNLDLVELGHSERRVFFNETDETVGLKTEAAVRHGLTPLICVGETLSQRDSDQAKDVLAHQVKSALAKLDGEQKTAALVFAYEPVWAIGAQGIAATADYADARQAEIVSVAADILGRRVPCLYGGSVNSDNCQELIVCPNIDGLFIGRAAWNVEGYLDILAKCEATLGEDSS